MKRACVTGGAGFIGSTLADRLSAEGVEVVVVDDFRTGRHEFVSDLLERPGTRLLEGDVLDAALLEKAFTGCDWVFHMQANADVRHGLDHPVLDLEQNTIATSTVLEAMRATQVTNIAFASTGSVSLYGASKLAGEGLISAYGHGYRFRGLIFRFVSVLGERYTHGHVVDFYRALKHDPSSLRVLGDGRQEKSYLYVQDCVSAMLTAVASPGLYAGTTMVYNLGTDETVTVDESVATIASRLGVRPTLHHTGGKRGWAGDSPLIHLDCGRIRALGWKPTLSIKQAIVRTLDWLESNPYAWREEVTVG